MKIKTPILPNSFKDVVVNKRMGFVAPAEQSQTQQSTNYKEV
jgi:hypothetical protein